MLFAEHTAGANVRRRGNNPDRCRVPKSAVGGNDVGRPDSRGCWLVAVSSFKEKRNSSLVESACAEDATG